MHFSQRPVLIGAFKFQQSILEFMVLVFPVLHNSGGLAFLAVLVVGVKKALV